MKDSFNRPFSIRLLSVSYPFAIPSFLLSFLRWIADFTDIKQIANGWLKDSRRTNSRIYSFDILSLSVSYPFSIRLRSMEGEILKELMHLQDVELKGSTFTSLPSPLLPLP